jgi:hypothetical protein
VVYVDFMTFVGRRRKRAKKMTMTQAELDEVISEKGEGVQAQLSFF